MAFLDDFDPNAPLVFLDQREPGDPFDVLLWDQRTGVVHLLVTVTFTRDGGEWVDDPRYVQTHENSLLVHACNVDDDARIPTVSERLEQLAAVIVRKDGTVVRRPS